MMELAGELALVRNQAVRSTDPANAPLQSTPSTLLLNLPVLNPELDYRVVAHSLVLGCVKANMVVDFIPDLIPQSFRSTRKCEVLFPFLSFPRSCC
jgi:hypothetical protein